MAEESPQPREFDISRPIPGYRTVSRIGAGGYGEVWKAEAPGDLLKAIKHIFSPGGGTQAVSELKALSRIKRVQHPFLLSIERVETIDEHLLIVSELAEASLKDRFHQCRQQGLPGIPRDELLGHLADAADALDFIGEKHSLQHLDIKPENLLLVGGRIKVGDFGLVKDLQSARQTMVSGLTPLYAAPELFDGRPHRRSDQYSLAIVFQEMLTGQLPFPGRTPAQLAVQHLQETPHLDGLPAADRAVVGRALAKHPEGRFPSCRALVDALRAAGVAEAAAAARASATGAADPSPSAETTASTSGGSCDAREAMIETADAKGSSTAKPVVSSTLQLGGCAPNLQPSSSRLAAAVQREMRSLGPIELSSAPTGLRPALFVGLGGTGAQVLLALRRRFREQFVPMEAVPAIASLLLDTDRGELASAASAPGGDALPSGQTLSMPLRSSGEYRADAGQMSKGMSRRWIYNVPRSRKTEGFRPLGRLALVDHLPAVLEHVREQVRAIFSPEAISESSHAAGTDFRDDLGPRVFVVGSVSGGTGSGAVPEMGYLVRQILSDLVLPADGLCGILVHASGCETKRRELAVANAYCCLSELYQYSHPLRGYPGDGVKGLLKRDVDHAPYPHLYFVHLGDRLSESQYLDGVEMVAEYLYRSVLAPWSDCLDLCRASRENDPPEFSEEPKLRTFGVCSIDLRCESLFDARARQLAKQTLDRWLSGEAPAPQSSSRPADGDGEDGPSRQPPDEETIEAEGLEMVEAMGVTPKGAIAAVREGLTRRTGSDVEQQLSDLVVPLLGGGDRGDTATRVPDLCRRVLSTIEGCLGLTDSESAEPPNGAPRLDRIIEEVVEEVVQSWASRLEEWILGQTDACPGRLPLALAGGRLLGEYLLRLKAALDDVGARIGRQRTAAKQALANAKSLRALLGKSPAPGADRSAGSPAPDSAIRQFAEAAVDSTILSAVSRKMTAFRRRLVHLCDALHQAWRTIEDVSATLEGTGAPSPPATWEDEPTLRDLWVEVDALLAQRSEAMLAEATARLTADASHSIGAFREMLRQGSEIGEFLRSSLPAIAREVVASALSEIDLLGLVAEDEGDERLEDLLARATPAFGDCGGAKRLLIAAPPRGERAPAWARMADRCGQRPTELPGREGELVLCYEVEGVSMESAAASLVGNCTRYAEVADRLHVRTDVAWAWGEDLAPTCSRS